MNSAKINMTRYGFCLLCLMALTSAAPSPKRKGIDVEKTVAQVEEVLRQNANLPRLSREDIMKLLNDIRAEDERSSSTSASAEGNISTEKIQTSNEQNLEESAEHVDFEFNEISDDNELSNDLIFAASTPPQATTARSPTSPTGSLMVVLPYTPRDGASLQELYTRPPRVALIRAPAPMRAANNNAGTSLGETKYSSGTKKLEQNKKNKSVIVPDERNSTSTTHDTVKTSPSTDQIDTVQIKSQEGLVNTRKPPVQLPVQYPDVSSELQEFLQQHGLNGNPGESEDHFLLPLDGFKPLPKSRIDGSVELPENILLTYDLLSASDTLGAPSHPEFDPVHLPPDTYVYEPLEPEAPFELEALSSETKKTVVPLDRKRKAIPNYEPIDYDSVKVIPLNTGPDPLSFDSESVELDVQKRQSENTTSTESPATNGPVEDTTSATSGEATTSADDTKNADSGETTTTTTSAPVRGDSTGSEDGSGPSIADLESSFGAPAPVEESDSMLPPPRKNGFYWMLDWNSFLEVGDGDEKVNIRFEPKLGDPQMFLPVSVP